MSGKSANIRFVAGGTVQAGDGVYVRRDADEYLYNYCKNAEFAYVLTSRQMGKSSLMVHTAERLIEEMILPVIIDITELGVEVTSDQWYRAMSQQVAEQLDLSVNLQKWWEEHQHIGVSHRFTMFLEKCLLQEKTEQIVIFVDEIDSTLRLDFTDDFFASIRHLYNARAMNHELNRLSFVLLGVASPGDLIKDRSRTPFNIGKRVELGDFKEEDAIRSFESDPELVRDVFKYTGGHPYLTLRVFRSLADKPLETSIDARMESLFFGDSSRRDSNLQFVRECLLPSDFKPREGETEEAIEKRRVAHEKLRSECEPLRERYGDVLAGKSVADKDTDPICTSLHLSGIVRGEDGKLKVRNAIYARVFNATWIKQNRTINWAKRTAWGVGILTALAIVGTGGRYVLAVKAGANSLNQYQIKSLASQIDGLQRKLKDSEAQKQALTDQLNQQKELVAQYATRESLLSGDAATQLRAIQDLQSKDKKIVDDLNTSLNLANAAKNSNDLALLDIQNKLSLANAALKDSNGKLQVETDENTKLKAELSKPVSTPKPDVGSTGGTLSLYLPETAKQVKVDSALAVYISDKPGVMDDAPNAMLTSRTFVDVKENAATYRVCVGDSRSGPENNCASVTIPAKGKMYVKIVWDVAKRRFVAKATTSADPDIKGLAPLDKCRLSWISCNL